MTDTLVRPRGRASVTLLERNALRERDQQWRSDAHKIANYAEKVVPLARYVRQYVAVDGEASVIGAQTKVIDFLELLARRHGGDSAA